MATCTHFNLLLNYGLLNLISPPATPTLLLTLFQMILDLNVVCLGSVGWACVVLACGDMLIV